MSSIPKTHIKTLESFALWMRDNDVRYKMQSYNGSMFIHDNGEYTTDELVNLFLEENGECATPNSAQKLIYFK